MHFYPFARESPSKKPICSDGVCHFASFAFVSFEGVPSALWRGAQRSLEGCPALFENVSAVFWQCFGGVWSMLSDLFYINGPKTA